MRGEWLTKINKIAIVYHSPFTTHHSPFTTHHAQKPDGNAHGLKKNAMDCHKVARRRGVRPIQVNRGRGRGFLTTIRMPEQRTAETSPEDRSRRRTNWLLASAFS
jgi:hypothetical protein